jgi:hypothetical protein
MLTFDTVSTDLILPWRVAVFYCLLLLLLLDKSTTFLFLERTTGRNILILFLPSWPVAVFFICLLLLVLLTFLAVLATRHGMTNDKFLEKAI